MPDEKVWLSIAFKGFQHKAHITLFMNIRVSKVSKLTYAKLFQSDE